MLIHLALVEDLDEAGDRTSRSLPASPGRSVVADVAVRDEGVVAGLALGPAICRCAMPYAGGMVRFEPAGRVPRRVGDGDAVSAGQTVARVRGARNAILAVERTLLNFLCRMSGVATLTRRYVEAARVANPHVQVLDTRKTIPGWRELDKYAVRCGGGVNHRFGLYDAVLIKDNHLAGVPLRRLAAWLAAVVEKAKGQGAKGPRGRGAEGSRGQGAKGPRGKAASGKKAVGSAPSTPQPLGPSAPSFIEVEVDSLPQLREVCKVPGIDIVLLDNFTLERLAAAVALRDRLGLRGRLALEASGGVTLDNVAAIARTGVDRISVGALTHSAPALDIALDF